MIQCFKYKQAFLLYRYLPASTYFKIAGKNQFCLTLAKKYQITLGRFFAMKPALFLNALFNSHKQVLSIPHSNYLQQNSLLQNQTTKYVDALLERSERQLSAHVGKYSYVVKAALTSTCSFVRSGSCSSSTSRFPTKSALDFVLGELYAKNTKRTQEQPLSKQGPYQMSTYLVVRQTNHTSC